MPDTSDSRADNSVHRFAALPPPQASRLPRLRRRRNQPDLTVPAGLMPLFHAALLYLAGIVVARYEYLRPGYLLAGLLPLAVVATWTIAKAPRLRWLPLAAIWVVLGIWSAETEPAPAPDAGLTQLSDGLLRAVEGTITDAGPLRANAGEEDIEAADEPANSGGTTQQIDLKLSAAEVVDDRSDSLIPMPKPENASVRIQIRWPDGESQTLQCGQRIKAVVRMLPPETFHDPGIWSRAVYLESQQISAVASLVSTRSDSGVPRLSILDNAGSYSAQCRLNSLRDNASARLLSLPELTRSLPTALRARPEDAAMLTALLTGDRTFLTRSLRVGFERTGSFHLIVVSGLHLAILAGCVFALSRRLRLPRLPATAITIAVTLGYALFTGFGIPAQRSFWVITLYLVGRLLYRGRSPLNVIGFATLCLAAASPRSIFDASLQMTLLSVTSIAGIAVPLLRDTVHARVKAMQDLKVISIDAKLPPSIAEFRVITRLLARHLEAATNSFVAWRLLPAAIRTALQAAELLFVTVVVEVALALPMAIYFHRITIYALPVNLCILPLLGLLLPAAMLLLIALSIWPPHAVIPAAIAVGLLHASVWIVRCLGRLAMADFRIPEPGTLQIFLAVVLFLAAVFFARRIGLLRRLAFPALAIMAVAAVWPRPLQHPTNALLFEAIDVGQGDSLLLITPDGKSLLIDGGGLGFISPATHSHSEFDVGEEVVSAVLWSRGIRRLDAVALTHAHHDHMGGLPAILRNFRPRELWVGNNPPVAAYIDLLHEADQLGVQVRRFHAGDSVNLGDASFRVLAPSADYRPGPVPMNNDSLVLQARYRDSKILLAGDAESPEEHFMLAASDLSGTFLKVGHHGSLTSTRPEFLAAIHPRWAVISCGRRNRFGHPRGEILAELQAAHVRTYRTDLNGASCFLLDGTAGAEAVTADPMCQTSR